MENRVENTTKTDFLFYIKVWSYPPKTFHRWLKAPSLMLKVTWIKKGNNNTIVTAILVHFNLIGVPNDQQRLSKDNTLVATAFVKLIPNF